MTQNQHDAAQAGYLWSIPQHKEAWRALAQEQGGRGLYMRFCHHLETDSIHLLDEAMKLLPEVLIDVQICFLKYCGLDSECQDCQWAGSALKCDYQDVMLPLSAQWALSLPALPLEQECQHPSDCILRSYTW